MVREGCASEAVTALSNNELLLGKYLDLLKKGKYIEDFQRERARES